MGIERARGVESTDSSIALLVGTALDPLLPLFALGIYAFFSNAVLDTAEAWSGIVALLTSFLAVGTGILDLPPFRTGRRSGDDLWRGRKRIHIVWNWEGIRSVHRGRHGGRRRGQIGRAHV